MSRFAGLEIAPYSRLGETKMQRIDRVRVEAHKTLFGAVVFVVVGQLGAAGEGVVVSRQFADFDSAWMQKRALERKINERRVQDAEEERRKNAISADRLEQNI